jgi:hypothetical protein
MSSYGFGFDDEVPGGYQDADLEMRELEEAGRNAGRISSPSCDPPDHPQPPLTVTVVGGEHHGATFELGTPDAFELEASGQLSIGVDGEQRAIPGLAPEGKPAPLTFERDATEKAGREELETIAAGLVTIADHGKTLEAGGVSFTVEVPASARARALRDARAAGASLQDRAQAAARTYTCGCCGSSLTADEAIYSRYTGQRYCPPGMCLKDPTNPTRGA